MPTVSTGGKCAARHTSLHTSFHTALHNCPGRMPVSASHQLHAHMGTRVSAYPQGNAPHTPTLRCTPASALPRQRAGTLGHRQRVPAPTLKPGPPRGCQQRRLARARRSMRCARCPAATRWCGGVEAAECGIQAATQPCSDSKKAVSLPHTIHTARTSHTFHTLHLWKVDLHLVRALVQHRRHHHPVAQQPCPSRIRSRHGTVTGKS
eukprot:329756-Chlamydomonas_euryale.AAC.2